MDNLINNTKRESALRLLKIGKLSNEEIAEGLGVDIEVVNALEIESKELDQLYLYAESTMNKLDRKIMSNYDKYPQIDRAV